NVRLFPVLGWLRTTLQRFPIPDSALPSVVGQLEILRKFERIRRTSILAKSAEHAATQVVGEGGKLLAARFFIALTGDNDQVLGSGQSTQVASNAHGLVGVRIDIETWSPPVSLGDLWPLQGVLLGIDLLWILITERDTQTFEQVEQ